MNRFTDKVVIITGGASGLGLASAKRLGDEGATLVLVDLKQEALDEAIAGLETGAKATSIVADVSDPEQVAAYVRRTVEAHGRIDGFFNNAGIEGKQNRTEDYGGAEFAKVLGVNLTGVFHGLAEVLKVMREQGRGSIVNTASVGGIRGVGDQSGYAASKHGVVGLTRNSAIEYGQYGVQINAIAPGAILTPMVEGSLRQMGGDDWENVGEAFVQPNPMKRFGKPEEVAALVAFLLSGEAGFINGAVITIDGGQSYKY